MKNYIVFIKKRIDMIEQTKQESTTNEFEEGNIFLEDKKKKEKEENGEEGEDEDEEEEEEKEDDNEGIDSDEGECYYDISDESESNNKELKEVIIV